MFVSTLKNKGRRNGGCLFGDLLYGRKSVVLRTLTSRPAVNARSPAPERRITRTLLSSDS
jgi:hypothetical protein